MTTRSLLPVIDAIDNFKPASLFSQKFIPFYLSLDHTWPRDIIGQIAPDVVEKILLFPVGVFSVQLVDNPGTTTKTSGIPPILSASDVKAIAFNDHLSTPEARSEVIQRVCLEWRTEGLFPNVIGGRKWRNEKFAIYVHPFKNVGAGREIAFMLERAACELFGFVTYGVQMTMYTPDYRIWVPRRSRTKQTWAGYLDNSVAGGIPNGIAPSECIIKECEEEASLAEDVCRRNVRVSGAISYFYQNIRGNLQPEVEYVFDMLCPEGDPAFVPKPLDGEVESFELMDWEVVVERLHAGEFKLNSAIGPADVMKIASWGSSLSSSAPLPPPPTSTSSTKYTTMPPRRAKKVVEPKPSSDSDSDHEAPSKSLTSKLASKLKSMVGIESGETTPASSASKRKRASSVTEHADGDDEVTAPNEPIKRHPRTKDSTHKKTPKRSVQTPAKRPRRSVAAVAKEDSASSDSESEDELATAPVSPVKPKAKGKAKATTTPPKPISTRARKSAPASARKSVPTSGRKPTTRKTRKTQDDYDSSIRELTHSSESPTPTESSDLDDLADYDPEREEAKIERDTESEEEEAALETMEVDSEALDDESDFGPHKIAERASASPVKRRSGRTEKSPKARKSVASSGRKSTGKRAEDSSSDDEDASDGPDPVAVGKVAGRATPTKRQSAKTTKARKSVASSGRKSTGKRAKEPSSDDEAASDEPDPLAVGEVAEPSPTKAKASKGKKSVASSGRKSTGKRAKKESSSEEEYASDESGPITVGKIVKAPTTGHVPPGQISQNTLDFLMNLQDPAKNDREWFKLHEPVYRLAEKEWVAFVDAWVTTLVEVDDEIPPLPPKDVIHRIYRDVRFSNDKTPYKPNFSASTSRSGRKGIFAGYHISIKPGGESMVAAGTWCPGKDEIQSIRNVIKRNHARRLRQILAEPQFVKYFGAPKPLATKGKERQQTSIFGREDELKVAPAGIKKDHPDIDLLKCRSFAVAYRFTDAQIRKKDFLEKTLKPVLAEMRPFVHCLNDYMTLALDEMSEGSSSSSSSDNE